MNGWTRISKIMIILSYINLKSLTIYLISACLVRLFELILSKNWFLSIFSFLKILIPQIIVHQNKIREVSE